MSEQADQNSPSETAPPAGTAGQAPESTTTAATSVADQTPIAEPSTAVDSSAPSSAQEAGSATPGSQAAAAGSSAASSPSTTAAEASKPETASPSESATGTPKSGTGAKSSTKVKSSTSQRGEPAGSDAKRASSPSPSPTQSTGGGQREQRRKRMKLGELDLSTAKIGFLGAGKMAETTINGLIHYAKISPKRIHVAAPTSKNLERFKALGCRVTKRNYDIFGRYDCDIVFLCFHGYVIKHCYKLGGSRPHPLTTNYIPHQRHPVYILSLVSGVTLTQIRACLLNPESSNKYLVEIHRIMMNTAVGHGLGICAVDCEPDSKKLSPPLRQLLSSIAQLEYVPSSQMDAACAIGGSGLAFGYYFINALADGAFKMGLSRQQAIRFASKTAQCAAQTMLESGKHAMELRDNVSSPSGAAIYGIHVLEKNEVASGVTAAVEAAHKRAHDLANQDIS